MVATVAVPRVAREEEEEPCDPHDPGEHHDEEDLPALELEENPPPEEEVKEEDEKALNQSWGNYINDLAEPVGVQNITVVEPLESRSQQDVTKAATRIFCRFRSMGVFTQTENAASCQGPFKLVADALDYTKL